MVFSSHIFIFYFLLFALAVYYSAPKFLRSGVLTLVSYAFYAWWNPWFVFLMLGSTVIDYYCGKMITAPRASLKQKKWGVALSVISNLSILGFFKYTSFLMGNLSGLMLMLGMGEIALPTFFYTIVLPVGISFYTFQSMSYSIDLYRGHAQPASSLVDFACYVSLFPQLVAGPIVRYGSIAEQLRVREHSLAGFVTGMTRFNLGFAKKILLANPMGAIADTCFQAGEGALSPSIAWVGIIAYSFQIYFDFSAYSDMAIGLGRLFGFRFLENFRSPYKADSITDFWRRWHISLSSFLRDYLYIPLGGNRKGTKRTYLNLIVVMFLGGLWHGAQWTFVLWGMIHGLMLAGERILGKTSFYGKLPHVFRVGLTFFIVLIAWVFFRAENIEVAWRYLRVLFGMGDVSQVAPLISAQVLRPMNLFFLISCALGVWSFPRTGEILKKITLFKVVLSLFLFLLSLIMMFTQGFNPFLYFQF